MLTPTEIDPDTLRRSGRLIAEHHHLDPAAIVMVGCIAATGRLVTATPSAEERAELVALAETTDGLEHFIESATSRAVQFASARWKLILAHAERLAAENLVCA